MLNGLKLDVANIFRPNCSKKHIQVKKLQNQIEKCTIDMAVVDDELNYCEDDSLITKYIEEYNTLKNKLQSTTTHMNELKIKMNELKKSLFTSKSCNNILFITINSPTTICITKNKNVSNENIQKNEVIKYIKLETFMCIQNK